MSGSGGGLGGTSEPGGGIAGLTGRLASPVGAAAIARQSGIVTPFVVLFATLSIASETFLRLPNLINILDQQAATVIVAAAGTLVLVAGGIDLSVGAVYALSGVTAATLASSADPLAAVVVGMFVGLVVGIANGIVVTRFRINALIATLAASYVVSGIGALVTRGNLVVAFEHPEFQAFAATRILGLTSAAWIMLAVTLILAVVLARSTFGRYVYASGGNADAARLAGVEVDRIRLAVFAISVHRISLEFLPGHDLAWRRQFRITHDIVRQANDPIGGPVLFDRRLLSRPVIIFGRLDGLKFRSGRGEHRGRVGRDRALVLRLGSALSFWRWAGRDFLSDQHRRAEKHRAEREEEVDGAIHGVGEETKLCSEFPAISFAGVVGDLVESAVSCASSGLAGRRLLASGEVVMLSAKTATKEIPSH